jgi:DNA-binding NtrC family response regulator
MASRKLLCVTLGGSTVMAEQSILSDVWDVCKVADIREADRILRDQPYLLGLLLLDRIDNDDHGELEQFLKMHWPMQWVGVFHEQVLKLPVWRELILEHLFDFHTRPIDSMRLNYALGHAYGYALLRDAPRELLDNSGNMALVGQSEAINNLRQQIVKVANANAPVLIWGESGSGKELTAQAIHKNSARADGPFVAVNCGAIPATLIQSELFGHERGAFTGASREKRGLIESAAGGTIFLDEIGDLPMDLQVNLLRFLQEKTINRVGSAHSIEVDVRVIAASHVNLEEAVRLGNFREDLFYRLNVLPLVVPPLRERKEDLELLIQHFFKVFFQDRNPRLKGFSGKAIVAAKAYDWPGNVRELINRVRRAMVMAEGRLITPLDLGLERRTTPRNSDALDDARIRAERSAIHISLQRAGKNITHAARDLGVSRMTLYRLMEKHGINS